jgi:dihydroorotate dehydrogenase (fumarate)
MTERRSIDLSATVASVRFPFCAMNASGARSSTPAEVRDLARSETGAIVLKSATVHPFVHPAYRSLHNPGYDKLLPLVRELAAASTRPVIASIAGATAEEYVTLARNFVEAGAALVEANLADPYVAATLAPWEGRETLRQLLRKLVPACGVPLALKLPERIGIPYRVLGPELRDAGVRVVVAPNDFAGIQRLIPEAGAGLEVIAVGGIRSGYDVSRALERGARAVQVGSALATEGPAIFARLAREMRVARGAWPE